MRIHRRQVLAGVLVGASATAAAGVAAGTPVRREISAMAPDDPDLTTFREGVRLMKARSDRDPLDPLGWHLHGAAHSIFCATASFAMQVHYGWFFLPWHRAYLWNLEQKIRTLTGVRGFALPYWDWTRSPRLPRQLFGEGNPIANTTRIYGPDDVLPADFTELGPAMRATTFRQFAGYDRDDPSRPQIEGALEQGAHNNVHNWIGGEMASFDGAGFDPMFSTHHGAVDRLWEAWRAKNPGQEPLARSFLDKSIPLWGAKGVERIQVRELLDTRALGYVYDTLDWRSTLTPQTTPEYPGAGQALATLDLDGPFRAAVSRLADRPGEGRILLTYSRSQIPLHPLCHRLFLLQSVNGRTEAHYAGTFTLLPIAGAKFGLDEAVVTQIETPPALARALADGGRVSVVAAPVPLKGRTIPAEPLRLRDVQLRIDV